MPAVAQKKSARLTLPPQKSAKAAYDKRKGRHINNLLKARIERERAAGLLVLPTGVRLVSSEVGERETGITQGTLRKWAAQGQVKYYRVGRNLRFTIEDILARAAAPWTSGEVA